MKAPTTRLLLGAALATALIVPASADASTLHKHRHHAAHHGHFMRSAPVGLYGGYRHGGPAYRYGGYGGYGYGSPPMQGPVWSGPNQCWEDLGYGRYEKCNW